MSDRQSTGVILDKHRFRPVDLNGLSVEPFVRGQWLAVITGFFQHCFKSAHTLALFQEK